MTPAEVVRVPSSLYRPPASLGLGLSVKPEPAANGRSGGRTPSWCGRWRPACPRRNRAGDRILSANGVDARDPDATRITRVGQRFALRVRRRDEVRNYTIVTVPNPPER